MREKQYFENLKKVPTPLKKCAKHFITNRVLKV